MIGLDQAVEAIADPECRRAVEAAIVAMRTAAEIRPFPDYGILLALRNGAEAIEQFNDCVAARILGEVAIDLTSHPKINLDTARGRRQAGLRACRRGASVCRRKMPLPRQRWGTSESLPAPEVDTCGVGSRVRDRRSGVHSIVLAWPPQALIDGDVSIPPRAEANMSNVNIDDMFAEFGIHQGPEGLQEAPRKNHQMPFVFDPSPYSFPDPAAIPKREWLLGRHYVRGVVGATLGAPGRLKSTASMTEVVGMAAGRDLLGGKPLECGPLRAAYLNGEENQDELDRRLAAILQHYRMTPDDCGGRLWIVSTRDNPMRLAVAGPRGNAVIAEDVVAALLAWSEARQIDVLVFDPLVSFHRLNENDTMDALLKEAFGKIAGKNRSVDLVVHPRKSAPGAIDTTVDDLRGASAQFGAIRTARVFNFMTTIEAARLGIDEEHRRLHVRVESGKSNPGPIEKATWLKIVVKNLPNGDDVACASSWTPPNPFDDVTTAQMQECRRLAQTGAYRADSRAENWLGYAVAGVIGIKLSRGGDNDKADLAKVKNILRTWEKNGVVKVVEKYDSEQRKDKKIIVPGEWNDGETLVTEADYDGVTIT
jgi:hypothetical protein